MSLKDHQELLEIRKDISYDEKEKRVRFQYPFNDKVSLMKNNVQQATKRAISQEKSLERKGVLEQYNEVVDDYILRGVWVEVSQEELDEWEKKDLPMHYLAHYAVINET